MISDDAIYESIFGKMPERPTEEEESQKTDAEDNRAPEEIAEELLSAVDEALSSIAQNNKKEN